MKKVVDIEEWKKLTEAERDKIVEEMNPYSREYDSLFKAIKKEFHNDYGHLKGLENQGIGDCHGSLVFGISIPYIFDRRKIPDKYLGFGIYVLCGDFPEGFLKIKKYAWAPENYKYYVDHYSDRIKEELENPNMTNEEMLEALCGMPFDQWIDICRRWGKEYTEL